MSAPAAEPARPREQQQRERARWIAVDWSELPGWGEDRAAELWPALRAGCARPAPGWAELCAKALLMSGPADDQEALLWLMQHLRPWRIESLDGEAQGLLTGYFEPELIARRQPQAGFQVPVLAAPPDLNQRRPYYTRRQIDSEPLKSRMRALVYIEDPIDLQVLQLQGSGRVRVDDEDGGRPRWLRMAFAGHNEQPLQPLGPALAAMGEWKDGPAAPRAAVRDWARRNPARLNELLWSNPRYVFFREEPLSDLGMGPRGAQGVPLTPGRSIAVDKASIPYGTPVWLDAGAPLRRLAMAQDSGSAIVGAVRADFFWGWGAEAEAQALRTKQPLRLWALWPRP
ncbi:murein transglycosylase A [Roseateles violae]|uniref:murein transglycosylase A n=1 Tax=Roseateles violae TaxID=3058042 RepID=UPI003133A6DF